MLYEPFLASATLIVAQESLLQTPADRVGYAEESAMSVNPTESALEIPAVQEPSGADSTGEQMESAAVHSERDWYWKPLVDAVGAIEAEQFEWKAETGTIQTYEHRTTFRYVHIDSVSGHFYNQQCEVITKEAALAHALRSAVTAKQAAAGEPVQSPVQDSIQNSVQESIQDSIQEPGLGAFTRAQTPETGRDRWTGVVSGFDSFTTVNWSGEISGALAVARRKVLATLGTGGSDGRETKARLVHAERELKEPSLATFMRRTSELER